MEKSAQTIFEIGFTVEDWDNEPVFRNQMARMSRLGFFEAFTMVHASIPALIYAPIAAWALWQAFAVATLPVIVGAFALGLGIWSLLEYTLHRWLFHLPRTGWFSTLIYLTFHGVHHMYPDDKYRLVMVPVVSGPAAVGFWFLFGATLPATWVTATFAGLLVGYLNYDYSHYATHWAKPPKSALLKPLASILATQRKRHMTHHYGDHAKGFGVSTALWDHVFGTVDPKLRQR